jgi:Rap1a immunity proteins
MRHPFALFSVLLFSVAAVPQQAASPSFSGVRDSANIFLAKCNSEHVTSLDELSAETFCQGYITGLSDAVEMSTVSIAPICPPEHVTPAQMGRIAVKYMHDHPEKTQKGTPFLIFEAWAAAFPCPAKK